MVPVQKVQHFCTFPLSYLSFKVLKVHQKLVLKKGVLIGCGWFEGQNNPCLISEDTCSLGNILSIIHFHFSSKWRFSLQHPLKDTRWHFHRVLQSSSRGILFWKCTNMVHGLHFVWNQHELIVILVEGSRLFIHLMCCSSRHKKEEPL